jgi:hypothetical protein
MDVFRSWVHLNFVDGGRRECTDLTACLDVVEFGDLARYNNNAPVR